MTHILKLGNQDDVAVALGSITAGQYVSGFELTTLSDIPAGHKVALRAIKEGEPVRKFNQIIGFASRSIAAGEHIHTHNLVAGDFQRDYAIGSDVAAIKLVDQDQEASFLGFRRRDGRVGTRNYIGILTTVNCSATVARRIAAHFTPEALSRYPNVDGVVAITHGTGCGMAEARRTRGPSAPRLCRLRNAPKLRHRYCCSDLGCETNQIDHLVALTGASDTPSHLDDSGGRRHDCAPFAMESSPSTRCWSTRIRHDATSVAASNLVLGLQCGGSDAYSGISANPALGAAVDLLVRNGGTAILSETPEIYGAEHLLTRRSARPEVAERLIDRIRWWEEYTARHKGSIDNNPQPGNKTGGLTTILEKSLGAVSKAGTTNLNEVYLYAEQVARARTRLHGFARASILSRRPGR